LNEISGVAKSANYSEFQTMHKWPGKAHLDSDFRAEAEILFYFMAFCDFQCRAVSQILLGFVNDISAAIN
jgi:hypothetical protein